jgi:hypothetical protein
MLYLIGGAPRCGKTTVARQLAQALCCSRVPADYLGTAFTNYIPEAELARRYPPWNTVTVDQRYATYSTAEVITNYRTKAATVWPGLRDFLIYAMYDQHEMVVEGYHLEPAFVHELRTTYPQFPLTVTAVFLCRTQCDQVQVDLRQSTDSTDWVLRSATAPVTFSRIATMVCAYSNLILAEAHTYGFPTFRMDRLAGQTFRQRSTAASRHGYIKSSLPSSVRLRVGRPSCVAPGRQPVPDCVGLVGPREDRVSNSHGHRVHVLVRPDVTVCARRGCCSRPVVPGTDHVAV